MINSIKIKCFFQIKENRTGLKNISILSWKMII